MESYIKSGDIVWDINFDYMAHQFLNGTLLYLGDKAYRVCEIEFYLNKKGHEDLYTQSCSDQQLYGYWYFHKLSTGTYRGGTFKGLDLTLGSKDSYCGILIRSIMDMKTEVFTEGPCCSVNTFLYETKCDESVRDFVIDPPMSCLANKRNFIIKDAKLDQQVVKKGPRIGLSANINCPQYRQLYYRYAIFSDKLKKHKM